MRIDDFKEMLLVNEPSFDYNGFEYAISQPNGAFCVYAEDSPADEDLLFDTVDDLLENWMIQGKPLKDILEELDFG